MQIAGGLNLYYSHNIPYSKLIDPVAKTLILTGDCLTPGNPKNNEFLKYLEANWSRIIYIHGDTELKCPGSITNGNIYKNIIHAHKKEHNLGKGPLGNIYTLYASSYAPWFDPALLKSEEEWLYESLILSPNASIVAAYGSIPKDVLAGNISAIIQGNQSINQFDPKYGPITNHLRSPNGNLRINYSPQFTLEFRN